MTTAVLDLSELVDLHGNFLFRFAYGRVRRREIAEELVQDTFLSAHQALDRFEQRSSAKSWLLSILRNKIIDYYRKSSKSDETSLDEANAVSHSGMFSRIGFWKEWLADWRPTPQEVLEQKDFVEQLQSCMRQLPDRLRQLLTLRVVDNVSSKEICAQLNITEGNFWVMLYRARMQMRYCLDQHWFKE